MGDSGAGKSETIEALKSLGDDKIANIEVVFDDMVLSTFMTDRCTRRFGNRGLRAAGDLDPATPYRDMNRSVFFNPDKANARVITPAAPYAVITESHPVDLFAYANNYGDGIGLRKVEDLEEAKSIFIEGKRMAKGTTQETGISTTYFANPFGPMQEQEMCRGIIDRVFDCLQKNDVFIGEVFTHLGCAPEDRGGIVKGAEGCFSLLRKIRKGFVSLSLTRR